ncbi:uncharacterized protein LOC120292938 [Eucalyptus grandis]|uniref:uncharacterized protein LOC120292938 n=1 Tax=Eucalyptus grandis TaxID=71139 RepID=UPI00192EBDED|nr:uncharacterized protein LOC120292938 [Eucalyptus grandis]
MPTFVQLVVGPSQLRTTLLANLNKEEAFREGRMLKAALNLPWAFTLGRLAFSKGDTLVALSLSRSHLRRSIRAEARSPSSRLAPPSWSHHPRHPDAVGLAAREGWVQDIRGPPRLDTEVDSSRVASMVLKSTPVAIFTVDSVLLLAELFSKSPSPAPVLSLRPIAPEIQWKLDPRAPGLSPPLPVLFAREEVERKRDFCSLSDLSSLKHRDSKNENTLLHTLD